MDGATITAILAGVGGLLSGIAAIIGVVMNNRKTTALIEYKMEEQRKETAELKEQIKEHNGYAQKFAECSTDIRLMQKDIEYIKDSMRRSDT